MTNAPGQREPWLATRHRRNRYRMFRWARVVVIPSFRVLLGMRIEGVENIPARGGALVISNHLHNSDPILLIAAYTRPVFFMAKKEAFQYHGARFFAELSGAFPVDRGHVDRNALRMAEQHLADGALVGIFPEGTRTTTGGIKDIYPGVAMIAARAKVPIIPTAIFGTETLPLNGKKGRRKGASRWPKVRVRIGKPFLLTEVTGANGRRDFAAMADQMMIEVAKLLPRQYRGIYTESVDRLNSTAPNATSAAHASQR